MKNYYSRLFAFCCLLLLSNHLHGQNLVLSTQVNNLTCNGYCNGSIDLTVSGGSPGLTYLWSMGLTGQDVGNLCAGTYTVTVTDANGITRTATATISQPQPIAINICVSNVSCYDGNTGKADLTVTGGTAPYNYLWSNGNTTQDLTNLVAGTYTPTVVDANGCTAVGVANITQPAPIVIASTVTNSSASGVPTGAIDLTVSGGTPPYTYSWAGPNGYSAAHSDLDGLNPGTYTVTVTDAFGCTRIHAVIIQVGTGGGPNPLILNGVVTNSSCGTSCTGSITATVSNAASGSYTYTWVGPNGPLFTQTTTSNTFTISSLCAGTYCLKVFSDPTNNTVSDCYTVGQGQSQNIDIQSSNAAFCNFNDGNSPSVCEMVCPHTTVTYFVEQPPVICFLPPLPFQGGTWTVSGAESYTVNPNGKEVVVTWGESGPGLVSMSSSNPDQCFESSRCITIVDEPVAKFSTDPPAPANAALQLCKGQTVSFKNESLHADQFEWLFSDNLSTTAEENPHHTFLTPGNFTVTLIARSNCLCADTTVLLVEVLDTEPPLLDCVGSVCPGETVKYSTSSNCSSYAWVVSPNGTVVDGGTANDNNITVQWADGPVGSISLSAAGCSGAACPQASVFFIPIISDNAEIRGNESVCPKSEEGYSIDLFDGTAYTWTLGSGGSIIRGQGTNKIAVAWTAPANANTTHWLSVEYHNCYLGCGGQDSIPVKILSPFFVQGDVEMCEQSPSTFNAKLSTPSAAINCNWTIYKEDGSVFWTSASASSSIFFPTSAPAGKYRVSAEPAVPGQTCSAEAELVVSVVARPPVPAAIDGPAIICPGTPLTYEVLGSWPYTVQWAAFNGTPASQSGNPANVTWLPNATRWLSATYVSNDGLGCKSDTAKINITDISVLSITGVPALCTGTVGFYTAEAYENFAYQWEIIPADAGAIKSGQGKNAVEVFWQTPGNHKIRVTTCGTVTDFNVTVWANPDPIVTHPTGACPGGLVMASTTLPYSAYAWQTANGNAISASPTPMVPSGDYFVEITDANGCKGAADFSIDLYPAPKASLTTADPTGFCNNGYTVSLTALVSSNGAFTYDWIKDGSSLGVNAPGYSTNQYGIYSVVVTNQYGCSDTAPPVVLYNYCGGGGGPFNPNPPGSGPPCPIGSVDIAANVTNRCDSVTLSVNNFSGQYLPGSAKWWTFISGGIMIDNALGDNASVTYPNAGKYIIYAELTLQSGAVCQLIDSVSIEAVAQFSQRPGCPGDSTMFVDESSRLPNASITAWSWDFGAAGTADTSSLASTGYPFATTGNYNAALTITAASGCTSTYAENVFVPAFPAPTFTPPLANCAGNASTFVLANSVGIIKTTWDFGDPAAGTLNQSAGNTVYHNYSPAGNYPVSVTATNTYGCLGNATLPVNIVTNPFSGNITPLNPVICEGKTITLIAPFGPNANYVWSDGTNQPTLVVGQEGIYDVTLTNGNGCTYSPPGKSVEVNPAPVGIIKALDINDLGQVIGVSYPDVSVCDGEDVTLQIQDNGTYSYQWSGGNGTDEILTFSEDRNNLLSVGMHIFTVTVTNPSSGCTTVLSPFDVTVNPVPSGFSLATNNVCAGSPSTITYSGPQPPAWQLYWNNGDTGPAITTEKAGLYFVRVVNEFGCSAKSNTVVIMPGPNVTALPSGCHERCNPDTLCIPAIPDIVSWQWYFEGNPVPGATSSQFVATQSGTYSAELHDINGCQAQSADLTVSLYDGFGDILGHVWSDVNNNGIVDAADTLVALIPVQLWQNGTVINTGMSGANGNFDWTNVLATNYLVQIDSQALSPQWVVVILSDSVRLSGCGGKVYADLLVDAYHCPPLLSTMTLTACPGSSANYNGTPILAGQSQSFTLQSILGCDSIVTVTVNALPTSTSSLNVSTCPGTTYSYQGTNLAVGQTQNFTLTNAIGCDSIVTVTVGTLPTSASTLNVSTCPGTVYNYQGTNLAIGQTQQFTLTNAIGCDSIVTVTVGALPTSASTLNVSTCPGTTYNYQGTNLGVGQTQQFTLSNALGCDSIVTVTVGALPTSVSTLNVSTCPGTTYSYQGTNLAIGQTQQFTLTNAIGCDSIVTVTVGALPTSASTLNVSTCPGTTYNYQGTNLAVGQTQQFTLSNALGCDSIVTVTVGALSTSNGVDSFGVCPNETYTYQGQPLSAGAVQQFTLTNVAGCDSIVTVTIYEKKTSAEIREVKVCPGQSYDFHGTIVNAGQVKDIHFTNGEGCDSLITIRVTAWPSLDFAVAVQSSCPTTGTGALSITVVPGSSVPTGYALNNGGYQTDTRFTALPAGTYHVTVQDENGCQFEQPATIMASPGLQLTLPGAFLIPCDSTVITLAPEIGGDSAGLHLTWWNGAQTPTVTMAEASPVWLEATNHCGETLHREAAVAWASTDGEPLDIYVPNIFAPAAKNPENTMLRAYFGNNLTLLKYHFEVYDRWGSLLFVSEQPEIGWEGPFRGKIMDPGVYVWQLKAKVAFCGREIDLYEKGDVTVER